MFMSNSIRSRSLTPLWTSLFLLALWAAPGLAQDSDSSAEAEAPAQAERVAVGDEAPDFELPDLDGNPHHLADLRGDKPVVLVFFRGAW